MALHGYVGPRNERMKGQKMWFWLEKWWNTGHRGQVLALRDLPNGQVFGVLPGTHGFFLARGHFSIFLLLPKSPRSGS